MEEAVASQTQSQTTPTQLPNPPSTAQCPPPQPLSLPLPPKSKKRPLDTTTNTTTHSQNSNYFKMRAVLKQLRPHFLEVLRTPDFRNCKAADEIREQMKLLVELHKEITAETISFGKSKNVPEGQNQDGQKPQEQPPTTEQPHPDKVFSKPSEKQRAEDGRSQGIHIVGGSAFGWNFVTYSAKEPVYYGETKESFRVRNPAK
ncbi:UV excision repair protein RAD23 homolog [Fagus crenata]